MKTKTLFAVMLCCLIFSCSVARTVAEKYPTEEEAETAVFEYLNQNDLFLYYGFKYSEEEYLIDRICFGGTWFFEFYYMNEPFADHDWFSIEYDNDGNLTVHHMYFETDGYRNFSVSAIEAAQNAMNDIDNDTVQYIKEKCKKSIPIKEIETVFEDVSLYYWQSGIRVFPISVLWEDGTTDTMYLYVRKYNGGETMYPGEWEIGLTTLDYNNGPYLDYSDVYPDYSYNGIPLVDLYSENIRIIKLIPYHD